MGNHGVEDFAFQCNTVVLQYHQIIFDVLPDFEYPLVFVDRFKFINYLLCFFRVLRNRYVKSLIFLDTKAQSHQFGTDGVGSGGLRV